MKILLVTGTDTGIGKTITTAAVAVCARAAGRSVAVAKPVQTGVGPDEPGDLEDVRRLAGDVPTYEGVRLPDPLAPRRAAVLAGATLPTLQEQHDGVLGLEADLVVVEGSGGVTVELGEEWSLLDLARSLADTDADVSWLVVVRAGLGTLNHTRMTVDAVERSRGRVHGVVIGAWPSDPGLAERHNLEDLPKTSGVPLLGRIPDGSGGLDTSTFRAQAPAWMPGYFLA